MPGTGFETGFMGETAVDVIESTVVVQGVSAICDDMMQLWSLYVDVSGAVGDAVVYPRFQGESSAVVSEFHGMVWSFHPTEGDWSRFTADLSSMPEALWESGKTTQMPCDESESSAMVWIYEVYTPEGQLGDCVIVGQDAMFYSSEFPDCRIWDS